MRLPVLADVQCRTILGPKPMAAERPQEEAGRLRDHIARLTSGWPSPSELRTDASGVADDLVRHDHRHDSSLIRNVPSVLEDGCTEAERDAVRAYVREEWIASQERWKGR
ncbi:hypothetical protein ACFU7T_13720 [Streptomyces sp. NPDC057555]|uniref:hypothetical protein n=1 Tax=Streptomyces sp. NPDC057555 TaxID=3346166 RepID=UPI00368EDAD9